MEAEKKQTTSPTEPVATTEPVVDPRDEAIKQLSGVTRSAIAQMNKMQSQMDELNKRLETPPAAVIDSASDMSDEEAKNLLFNSPNKLLDKFRASINDDLKRTIAPLIEFTGTLRSETAYEKAKKAVAQDPAFKDVWSQIEPYIDQALSSNPNVNMQTVQAAAYGIVGAAQLGRLEGFTLKRPDVTRKQDETLPPHLRSSAPPGPSEPKDTKKLRELTELEKRIARENRQTDEQYLELLEGDSMEFMKKKKEVTK